MREMPAMNGAIELATAAIAAVKQGHSREQLAASLQEFNENVKAAANAGLLPLV